MGVRLVDVGSFVTPNDKIGTFIQVDKVYAEFNVIEKDVPKIALKQKVDIFVDAYPAKSLNGQVDRIAPIIEGRSRTQTVKVELSNKDGALKPGMFIRGLIYTYEKKEALVVPSSSLKKKEADYFVYVVHKEELKQPKEEPKKEEPKKGGFTLFGMKGMGKKEEPKKEEKPTELGSVEARKIKVGYMTQDLVEVQEGLKEEELVVVEVQEEFKDKAKVEIMETQESIF
jgi:multidrug efflux pump subunit AcrA (membrane-fusion protein)